MGNAIQIRPGILEWREIEGEVVAVDTRTATYLAVNASGAKLWPVLLRGGERDELVETLVGAFGLDDAAAAADVGAFLEMLAAQDLLES